MSCIPYTVWTSLYNRAICNAYDDIVIHVSENDLTPLIKDIILAMYLYTYTDSVLDHLVRNHYIHTSTQIYSYT